MKNIFIVLFFCVGILSFAGSISDLVGPANAFEKSLTNGEYKQWWDNGQIAAHAFLKDGQYDGEFKVWDRDGKLLIHCWYKDGKLNGEYESWYGDGRVEEHSWYKNGEKVEQKESRDGYTLGGDGYYYQD